MSDPNAPVTELLQQWSAGDPAARDQLMEVVYEELRRIAGRYMQRENPGHTLQATAVVNEAYLRLAAQNMPWRNRAQFFGLAAQLMRRILVDHARGRGTARRGGDPIHVSLEAGAEISATPSPDQVVDLLALDQALTRMAGLDPRQVRIVELRFFAGLSIAETAEVVGVSHTIVERDWALARAWLRRELREPTP